MKAVANSTPLIYLSKARAINILFKVYEETIIPETVYKEVVVNGPRKGYRDAELVRIAVEEGAIKIEKAPSRDVERILKLAPMLHRGEAEVLALALHHKPCHVLLDDRVARLVASTLGLEVHGTLYVVAAATAKNVVNVKEALNILDELMRGGFRISVELYLETREKLLKLKKK